MLNQLFDCITVILCIIIFPIGVPEVVPGLIVISDSINVNADNVTLTISWGEPFNNFDPIVSYTVECASATGCVAPFTTDDNSTRTHTFTNLSPTVNYTFSVFATNSLGDGMAASVTVNGLSGICNIIMNTCSL